MISCATSGRLPGEPTLLAEFRDFEQARVLIYAGYKLLKV